MAKKYLVREAVETVVGHKAYKLYIEKLKGNKANGYEYGTDTIWKIKFCFDVNDLTAKQITKRWTWEMRLNEESLNHYLPINDHRVVDNRYNKKSSDRGYLGILIYTTEDPTKEQLVWNEAHTNWCWSIFDDWAATNKKVGSEDDYKRYAACESEAQLDAFANYYDNKFAHLIY